MARKKKNGDNGEINSEDITEYFKKETKAGKIPRTKDRRFISTGSTWLDWNIANIENGGIPQGRITEVCGNEATGKSLLAYHILANTQKLGGVAVYIDIERSLDEQFMSRMGVDVNKLIIPKKIPDHIEGVFEYIENIVKAAQLKFPDKKTPVTVVWDSVAATMAKETIEQKYGDGRITPEARAMSDCFKRSMPMLELGFVTLVCVNQLRTKIGTMFGDPDITPHGKALPFYASVRIKMEKVGFKKLKNEKDRVIGIPTKATVFKNKVAPAHREARFNLMFDWGIDDAPSLYYLLEDAGIIKKNHGWRTYTSVGGKPYQFQDSDGTGAWRDLLENDSTFRKSVLAHVEKELFQDQSKRPKTYKVVGDDDDKVSINTESLLEMEQLKDNIAGI